MGNLFQSILCCAGDSDENLTNTQYQSTGNTKNIKQTQSRDSQWSKTNNQVKQVDKSPAKNSDKTINKTAINTKMNNSNNNNNHKSNVRVYEATDSTVETSNYDAGNENYQVTTSYVEKNNTTHDSDFTSNDEDEMIEDEYNDDLFDLTKLQTGQAHASTGWLLEPQPPQLKNKKCLILDLDETLVHSSFKYLRHADFVIPVDIDNQLHNVYVIKRPGVDEFMKRVGKLYEVVIFTASVSRYGDPLLDALDIHHSIHHRLFRDSCYNYQGNYIKNLSQIGRPLNDIIILDNSPASYIFHPQHAIPISSWFSDAHDNELLDIIPFLEDLAKENVEDVGLVLDINL